MNPTETTDDVERYAARFRECELKVQEAEEELARVREECDNVLREAQEEGVNMSALAKDIGIHRTRLYQRMNRGSSGE